MTKAQDIIKAIQAKYPQENIEIPNISDLDIGEKVGVAYQYIFGLTPQDPMEVSHYRTDILKALDRKVAKADFMPWPFRDNEIEEVRAVLKELAEHYKADLDIERMIPKLGINGSEGRRYFLVVVVNHIPVLLPEIPAQGCGPR